jgi:hypothetical protein
MRLLNTTTLQLEDFIDDRLRPPYAILSHTWGEEEVLHNDLRRNVEELKLMRGYAKN